MYMYVPNTQTATQNVDSMLFSKPTHLAPKMLRVATQ